MVYCEIDSVLPESNPAFAFLKDKKFRIKTVRLRGQISQGIIFPLSILPLGVTAEVGDDVTDILGVIKYEPLLPTSLGGNARGNFPSFIPKTDETRVQTCGDIIGRYTSMEFVATEKLEGTSCTAYKHDGVFSVCSRNIDFYETLGNAYWDTIRKEKLEEKINNAIAINLLPKNVALQGEVIGWGIQGNIYKLAQNELAFYLFDIFDIDKYRYLSHDEVTDIAQAVGIKTVPEVMRFKLTGDIDELLKIAEGKSYLNTSQEREGLVFRPLKETWDREFGRVSFKAISNRYLLKEKTKE